MPRLKTPDPPFIAMRRLLLGYGMNGPLMGRAMGTTDKTGKRRLDHPEELTLGELKKLSRAGIPAEEIRDAIKF